MSGTTTECPARSLGKRRRDYVLDGGQDVRIVAQRTGERGAAGVGSGDTATHLWPQLPFGPSVAWKVTRVFWLRGDMEVVWRRERPLFTDSERTGLVNYRPEWVGVRGGVALEAHFR